MGKEDSDKGNFLNLLTLTVIIFRNFIF